MKKIVAILAACLMVLGVFTACAKKDEEPAPAPVEVVSVADVSDSDVSDSDVEETEVSDTDVSDSDVSGSDVVEG